MLLVETHESVRSIDTSQVRYVLQEAEELRLIEVGRTEMMVLPSLRMRVISAKARPRRMR